MFESIVVQRFSVGSIYKIFAIGASCSLVPFSLLMGIFALFGANTVTWNGQVLTGVVGLLASPFIGLFLAVLFTGVLGTMLVFGLWLYSKFRSLKLSAKRVSSGANE